MVEWVGLRLIRDPGWGDYNEYGVKEVGNAKSRSISNELDRLVHNIVICYKCV